MQHHQPTTIAILGPDTMVEGILSRLLHKEGYATRLLDPNTTGAANELLDGVDALLLTPGLDAEMSGTFLEASWRSLFDELVAQMGAALQRAAASTRALMVDSGDPAAQADAP